MGLASRSLPALLEEEEEWLEGGRGMGLGRAEGMAGGMAEGKEAGGTGGAEGLAWLEPKDKAWLEAKRLEEAWEPNKKFLAEWKANKEEMRKWKEERENGKEETWQEVSSEFNITREQFELQWKYTEKMQEAQERPCVCVLS